MKMLLVEDNLGDARLLRESLKELHEQDFEIVHVERLADGLSLLNNQEFEVVLLDLSLPDSTGLDTVKRTLEWAPDTPIVVLTGAYDESLGMQAVRMGAQDYLIKGQSSGTHVARAVRYSTERQRSQVELRKAHDELEQRVHERTSDLEHALTALQEEFSDRIKAEEDLRKSEMRFRQMAEAMPEVLWLASSDMSVIHFVNPSYEQIWGVGVKTLFQDSRSWINAVDPQDRPKVENATGRLAEAMERGENTFSEEFRVIRPDDTVAYVHLRLFAIKDEHGRVSQIGGICDDVTDRNALQRQVTQISELERRNLSQDLHDVIGQNLTGVAFLSKACAQRLTQKKDAEADEIMKIAEMVNRAIAQVRALARGLQPVELQTDGLMNAITELCKDVNRCFEQSCQLDVQVNLIVSDSGHATHIFYIVREAVMNAVKHSQANTITIRVRGDGDQATIFIEDDGVGMSPEAQGKGMGLAIMQYRSNMIGATLEVQPGEQAGTVVTCRLPATVVKVQPDIKRRSA